MRCTSLTLSKNGKRFGTVCKRNCAEGTDFCYQHSPLNKLEDTVCAICLEDIKNPMKMTACRHIFCKKCITDSFLYGIKCPCCRQQLDHDDIVKCIKVKLGNQIAKKYELDFEMSVYSYKWKHNWTKTMQKRFLEVYPQENI